MPVIKNPSLPELDNIVDAAKYGMQAVQAAYQAAAVESTHVEWVIQVRDQMVTLLAGFEDGGLYRMAASGEVEPATLTALRYYEIIANDWLDAVFSCEDCVPDQCVKLGPGWYSVIRTIESPRGNPIVHSVECANPAYGFERLDEWEDGMEDRWVS